MSDSAQMVTSVRCARCSSDMLSHPAAQAARQAPAECVVVRRSPTGKTPPPHLCTRPRDNQHVVPAGGPLSRPGLRHSGDTSRQLLRLAAAAHLVREAHSVVCGHALRAEPPQSLQQIRNVIVFPTAEKYLCCIVNDLKPAEVSLLAAPIN